MAMAVEPKETVMSEYLENALEMIVISVVFATVALTLI